MVDYTIKKNGYERKGFTESKQSMLGSKALISLKFEAGIGWSFLSKEAVFLEKEEKHSSS